MPSYAWEGRTRAGDIRRGTMDAEAEPDVQAKLRAQNISVTKVNKRIGLAQRLSGIKKASKLKSQIRGAMIYPIAILCISALVITVMLWKVIPVFENMFKEFGNASLPGPTLVVIAISHGFINNLPAIGTLGAIFFF